MHAFVVIGGLIVDETALFNRRSALVGAGAAALLASNEGSALPLGSGVPPRAIVDAHAHLFNGADLPAQGFIAHVVARERLTNYGPLALAAIDHAVSLMKFFTVSADIERRQLERGELPAEITPEQFASASALRAVQASGGSLDTDTWTQPRGDLQLEIGYQMLSVLLSGSYAPDFSDQAFVDLSPSDRTTPRAMFRSQQMGFINAARNAYSGFALSSAQPPFGREPRFASLEHRQVWEAANRNADEADFAKNVVPWAFLMKQPRSQHVEKFLSTYSTGGVFPRVVLNLLVDYDAWLSDRPGLASEHSKQHDFWLAAKRYYSARVDIKTFAGFCPLKQALSVYRGDHVKYLDSLKAAYAAGKIVGLKFYPPMGFRALRNADLDEEAFVGKDAKSIGRSVIDNWRRVAGPTVRLGQELDAALRAAYDWCAGADIPIVAHAGPHNAPAEGFDERANPTYWCDALAYKPTLRLLLGHFCANPIDFVKAMKGQPSNPVWPLDGTQRLLRGYPNVYVDLSYISELLTVPNLPRQFFEALKTYCSEGLEGSFGPADPNFERIVYGSDWIMLGLEGQHPRYLTVIRQGMRDAQWPEDAIDRVCETNARRFLRMAA